MTHNWRAVLLAYIIIMLGIYGCGTKAYRGVTENNVYFSSQNPNVQIKINGNYKYRKGTVGKFKHQFLNPGDRRGVYIHFWANDLEKSLIEHYHNPDHWIYQSIKGGVEIERLRMELAGIKWYVRDVVAHNATDDCHMIRNIAVFTERYDVFKLLYFEIIPPYSCKDWKTADSLNVSQQKFLDHFRNSFEEVIEITAYSQDL